MSKQCLDVQQMQHLQELGLDTSNASMCWIKDAEGNRHLSVHDEYCYEASFMNPIPAYTLQDVLDLLPKSIGVEYIYDLCIFPESISYTQFIGGEINDNLFAVPINESLIDAAYMLLIWVIENGYISKLPTNKNSK